VSGISILSDTNPLIYLLDGNKEVAEYIDGKQVWISAITELELFGKKSLNKPEINEINHLINNCIIADINAEIKQITKELLQGSSVKLPDAIIAATSFYLDLPLFTSDTDFKNISGLNLVLLEF
jgi:predicted nucleic acid-binding protein